MAGAGVAALLGAVLAVGVGAFAGGLLRGLLRHRPGGLAGTLVANLTACLALGLILGSGLGTGEAPPGETLWQLALGTGFCGALSTWSTLAGELGSLLRERSWNRLAGYLTATLGAGLGLIWFGWQLGGLLG
ncbi:fluoride efflux transporter FluC [Corynebacterium halotolerans]|uniref:fluoride efflux transporter FluC n=1 Tax=Corynebacterium halotolerans TaxID=225326 RepID=UPI003CEE5AF8